MQNSASIVHASLDSFTLLTRQFTPLGKGLDIADSSIVYTYCRRADGSYDEVMKYDIQHKKMFLVDNYRSGPCETETILVLETGVIDMKTSGERWEGEHRMGIPFGWGCLYDDDNHKVYEGFIKNGHYDGYGTEYYPEMGVKQYEGMFLDGQHCGRGRAFDLHGDRVVDGEFFDALSSKASDSLSDASFPICNRILHMVIDRYKSPLSCFDIRHLPQLRDLRVQGESFPWTHSFHAVGHLSLEQIAIDEACFGASRDWETSAAPRDVFVAKCPHLTSCLIGDDCFRHSRSFHLRDCSHVVSLVIGHRCFRFCKTVVVERLEALQTVEIASMSFDQAATIHFRQLPTVESVTLGFFVFDGEYCDESSELQMIHLPSLKQLQCSGFNFRGTKTVLLEDLTSLMQSGCIMGDSLFSEVSRLEAKQADALEDFIHYYSADLE